MHARTFLLRSSVFLNLVKKLNYTLIYWISFDVIIEVCKFLDIKKVITGSYYNIEAKK